MAPSFTGATHQFPGFRKEMFDHHARDINAGDPLRVRKKARKIHLQQVYAATSVLEQINSTEFEPKCLHTAQSDAGYFARRRRCKIDRIIACKRPKVILVLHIAISCGDVITDNYNAPVYGLINESAQ